MTLEVIPDGWLEGPMVLFWGGGATEVTALRAAFRALAAGVGVRVAFHDLPFMTAAPNAGLVGVSSPDDRGVVLSETTRSEWILTPAWWDNAEGLLVPFSDSSDAPSGSYQFLHQGIGMPVIYSTSRAW